MNTAARRRLSTTEPMFEADHSLGKAPQTQAPYWKQYSIPKHAVLYGSAFVFGLGMTCPMTMDMNSLDSSRSATFDARAFSGPLSHIPSRQIEISDVERFLSKNPDLVQPLEGIKNAVSRLGGVRNVLTSYYLDPDEGFERLFVDVTIEGLDDQQINELEDIVFRDVVDPVWAQIQNRVAVSIKT